MPLEHFVRCPRWAEREHTQPSVRALRVGRGTAPWCRELAAKIGSLFQGGALTGRSIRLACSELPNTVHELALSTTQTVSGTRHRCSDSSISMPTLHSRNIFRLHRLICVGRIFFMRTNLNSGRRFPTFVLVPHRPSCGNYRETRVLRCCWARWWSVPSSSILCQ